MEGVFKLSHLDEDHHSGETKERGAGFEGDHTVIRPPVVTSTNSKAMGVGGDHGGSVKAVRMTTLLLMALVGVVCLLSIVLSGLALSRVTSIQSSEKIWTFAIGESYFNMHYIDNETLELDGFDVEMVKAVCEVAGKRCEIVTDDYTNCWFKAQKGLPARGGDGLNGGYYDACVGWHQTPERRRAFAFSKPYAKPLPSAFFVPIGTSNFDISNMAGKRIGFIAGYTLSDEHCLNRQDDVTGLPLTDDQIIHYATPGDADDALANNEIDALFTIKYLSMEHGTLITTRNIHCSTSGSSLMTRKSSILEDWWNPAWETLWASKEYHSLCETLEERHGPFPGLPLEDICLHLT